MISIDYFMSHGSPWTFLGHGRLGELIKKFNVNLNMYPVNYGEIFPISGGLPVSKRPPQRQNLRLWILINKFTKKKNLCLHGLVIQLFYFKKKMLIF